MPWWVVDGVDRGEIGMGRGAIRMVGVKGEREREM